LEEEEHNWFSKGLVIPSILQFLTPYSAVPGAPGALTSSEISLSSFNIVSK
jgi:hypothetical protein